MRVFLIFVSFPAVTCLGRRLQSKTDTASDIGSNFQQADETAPSLLSLLGCEQLHSVDGRQTHSSLQACAKFLLWLSPTTLFQHPLAAQRLRERSLAVMKDNEDVAFAKRLAKQAEEPKGWAKVTSWLDDVRGKENEPEEPELSEKEKELQGRMAQRARAKEEVQRKVEERRQAEQDRREARITKRKEAENEKEEQFLDGEEKALQEALRKLAKQDEEDQKFKRGRRKDDADDDELKSETFRKAQEVSNDVRSFVRGTESSFKSVQNLALDKLLINAKLFFRVSDYVVRRAAFDTKRLIIGSARAFNVLPSFENEEEKSTSPFARRAKKIVRNRQALPSLEENTAEEAAEKLKQEEQANRTAEAVEDAVVLGAVLVGEVFKGAQAVVEAVLTENSTVSENATIFQGPDAATKKIIEETTGRLGEAVSGIVADAQQAAKEDFEGYEALRTQKALPTIAEELGVPQIGRAAKNALPALPGADGGDGKLRAFANQNEPDQQLKLQQRQEAELAAKKLKLVGTLGVRGAKDAGDTFAYGVMPAVSAVGKVASRRIADQLPPALANLTANLTGAEPPDASSSLVSGGKKSSSGTANLMGELATEMAKEYSKTLDQKVGKSFWQVPNKTKPQAEVVQGKTTRIDKLKQMGNISGKLTEAKEMIGEIGSEIGEAASGATDKLKGPKTWPNLEDKWNQVQKVKAELAASEEETGAAKGVVAAEGGRSKQVEEAISKVRAAVARSPTISDDVANKIAKGFEAKVEKAAVQTVDAEAEPEAEQEDDVIEVEAVAVEVEVMDGDEVIQVEPAKEAEAVTGEVEIVRGDVQVVTGSTVRVDETDEPESEATADVSMDSDDEAAVDGSDEVEVDDAEEIVIDAVAETVDAPVDDSEFKQKQFFELVDALVLLSEVNVDQITTRAKESIDVPEDWVQGTDLTKSEWRLLTALSSKRQKQRKRAMQAEVTVAEALQRLAERD